MPAPSLQEMGGLTSESGGSGDIGVDGHVTEVTERFGGYEKVRRLWKRCGGYGDECGVYGDLDSGAVMQSKGIILACLG